DSGLHVACMILDKEIKYIDGKNDNIIIPHMYMNKLQEEKGMKNKKYTSRP
ncbi:unnamed protein product, partial [Didymodactylos carnosus]